MKYNLNNPTLILFHATWCGHCKTFMPTFDKFAENVNNSKVNLVKFNADKDKKYITAFNVEGFPTLMLHDPKSQKYIEYNGDRSMGDLVRFVNQNCNVDITQ